MINKYIEPVPPPIARKNNVKYRPLPPGCLVDQPEILPRGSSKIELTRGLFAIVDSEFVDDLNRFSWSAAPDGHTCYAVTRDVNKKNLRMHRHLLKINNDENVQIDHINGNGIDNRLCNLRIVTRSENQRNRRPKTKEKNRFKGVLPGLTKGWTTYFKIDGKVTKKNFVDEVKAARYYDYLVFTYRGPKAPTNLSMGRYTPEEIAGFDTLYKNPLAKAESSFGPDRESAAISSANHRISLLEDQLRITEAELKRYTDKS